MKNLIIGFIDIHQKWILWYIIYILYIYLYTYYYYYYYYYYFSGFIYITIKKSY